MAYGDFTLKTVETRLGVPSRFVQLFDEVPAVAPPVWLRESLGYGLELPMVSEKMRGELIVMPILMGVRLLADKSVTVYSGARLDVDVGRGLQGECDFLVSRGRPHAELQPPFLAVVEAKKADIELGLGQCAAQMVGAQLFNEREGRAVQNVYGCVTSGEVWQFLRLSGTDLEVDTIRYYLDNLPGILGVFQAILAAPPKATA